MKKLMTSKVAALVALSMTLALAVVTCGPTPSRGRLLGTLELAYPVVLAGEHQSVTIAITNDSREEARIITLQSGSLTCRLSPSFLLKVGSSACMSAWWMLKATSFHPPLTSSACLGTQNRPPDLPPVIPSPGRTSAPNTWRWT